MGGKLNIVFMYNDILDKSKFYLTQLEVDKNGNTKFLIHNKPIVKPEYSSLRVAPTLVNLFANTNDNSILVNMYYYSVNAFYEVQVFTHNFYIIKDSTIYDSTQNTNLAAIQDNINNVFTQNQIKHGITNFVEQGDFLLFYETRDESYDTERLNDFLLVNKNDFSMYRKFDVTVLGYTFSEIKVLNDNNFLVKITKYDENEEKYYYYQILYTISTNKKTIINTNNTAQAELYNNNYDLEKEINYAAYNKSKYFVTNIPQGQIQDIYYKLFAMIVL